MCQYMSLGIVVIFVCIINLYFHHNPISKNQRIILKEEREKHQVEIKETLYESLTDSKLRILSIQIIKHPKIAYNSINRYFPDFLFVYSIAQPIMHLGLSRIYASVFPQAIHHSLSSEATSHVSTVIHRSSSWILSLRFHRYARYIIRIVWHVLDGRFTS